MRAPYFVPEHKKLDRLLQQFRKRKDHMAIVVDEYGLRPDALIFDDLTFTLATGDAEFVNSGVETIRAFLSRLWPNETFPDPPHSEHVRTDVPGLAPSPSG